VKLNPVIDIRDFRGTAGFSLLAVAAATQTRLPIAAVWQFLLEQSRIPGCERAMRSSTYLQRRRWMFLPFDASNVTNRDGKDQLAFQVMAECPEASLRDLVGALKEHGVTRSREWVRRHRCVTD
jgi:hypothetical protein